MNVDTIPDFLAESRDAAPADLQHLFISFEDLWERKLWHQLTDALVEFFDHEESANQRYHSTKPSFSLSQTRSTSLSLSLSP